MRILRKIAGWWKIDNIETGQIDQSQPDKKKEIINVIPGKDSSKELYNGDGPADIMDGALDRIAKEYREQWEKEPELDEIKAVFNFCFNGLKRSRK